MLRTIFVLSCSLSAVASSVGSADQTLPAINVKYDFPPSSTLASAKESLDVMNRDALFAKRVQRKSGHGYQLISDNPNYEPLEVNEEDEDAFRLIGRILWVGKQV